MTNDMQSTSLEYEILVQAIENCCSRPGMYGQPEHVEITAKHITHICFTTVFPEWSFDSTERVWADCSMELFNRPNFTDSFFEANEYIVVKWGEQKNEAMGILIFAFQAMWVEIKNRYPVFPKTANWIDALFSNKCPLGSPDAFDTAMFVLIILAIRDLSAKEKFRELYLEKAKLINGSASRGLQDVATSPKWKPMMHGPIVLDANYKNLVSGLRQIINCIKQMKDQSGLSKW